MSAMTRRELGQALAVLGILAIIIYMVLTELLGVGAPPGPWVE